jgi:hypothetical protein
MTTYNIRPATATKAQVFHQNVGQDPAKYLVPDGNLYHARPSLISGDKIYIWPVGTEGVRQSGQATLAVHHYFGDDDAEVQIIHQDESRIELNGTMPGITSVANMAALRLVVRDSPPEAGKILLLPGIFERVQYVVVENYDFVHDASDRTHSFDYTISFVRTGVGKRIRDPHGKPAPTNPGVRTTPRGKAARWVGAKSGAQTFRQIAKKVYGNQNKWAMLANLNARLIADAKMDLMDQNIAYFNIPNYRWPLGTHIFY